MRIIFNVKSPDLRFTEVIVINQVSTGEENAW